MPIQYARKAIVGLGSTIANFYNVLDEEAQIDESRLLSHTLSLGNPIIGHFVEKAIDKYGYKFGEIFNSVKNKLGGLLSSKKKFNKEEEEFSKMENNIDNFEFNKKKTPDTTKNIRIAESKIKKLKSKSNIIKKSTIKKNPDISTNLDKAINNLEIKVKSIKSNKGSSSTILLNKQISQLENFVDTLENSSEENLDTSINDLNDLVNSTSIKPINPTKYNKVNNQSIPSNTLVSNKNLTSSISDIILNVNRFDIIPKGRLILGGKVSYTTFISNTLNDILYELKIIRISGTNVKKPILRTADVSPSMLSKLSSVESENTKATYSVSGRPTLTSIIKPGKEYSYESLMIELAYENTSTNYYIYRILKDQFYKSSANGVLYELVEGMRSAFRTSIYNTIIIKQITDAIAKTKFIASQIYNSLEGISGAISGLLTVSTFTSSLMAMGMGSVGAAALGSLGGVALGAGAAMLIKKSIRMFSNYRYKKKILKTLPGPYSRKISILFNKDETSENKLLSVQIYAYERLAEISNHLNPELFLENKKKSIFGRMYDKIKNFINDQRGGSRSKKKTGTSMIVRDKNMPIANQVTNRKKYFKNTTSVIGVGIITYIGYKLGSVVSNLIPAEFGVTGFLKTSFAVVSGLSALLLLSGDTASAINVMGYGLIASVIGAVGYGIYKFAKNHGFSTSASAGLGIGIPIAGAILAKQLASRVGVMIGNAGGIGSVLSTAGEFLLTNPVGWAALAAVGISAAAVHYNRSMDKELKDQTKLIKRDQKLKNTDFGKLFSTEFKKLGKQGIKQQAPKLSEDLYKKYKSPNSAIRYAFFHNRPEKYKKQITSKLATMDFDLEFNQQLKKISKDGMPYASMGDTKAYPAALGSVILSAAGVPSKIVDDFIFYSATDKMNKLDLGSSVTGALRSLVVDHYLKDNPKYNRDIKAAMLKATSSLYLDNLTNDITTTVKDVKNKASSVVNDVYNKGAGYVNKTIQNIKENKIYKHTTNSSKKILNTVKKSNIYKNIISKYDEIKESISKNPTIKNIRQLHDSRNMSYPEIFEMLGKEKYRDTKTQIGAVKMVHDMYGISYTDIMESLAKNTKIYKTGSSIFENLKSKLSNSKNYTPINPNQWTNENSLHDNRKSDITLTPTSATTVKQKTKEYQSYIDNMLEEKIKKTREEAEVEAEKEKNKTNITPPLIINNQSSNSNSSTNSTSQNSSSSNSNEAEILSQSRNNMIMIQQELT